MTGGLPNLNAPATTVRGIAEIFDPITTLAWSITNGTITSGQGTDSIVYQAGLAGSLIVEEIFTSAQ